MEIKILRINAKRFMSISDIELNLENRGLVRLHGINKSDSLSSSNGSGKSSIFEAILWTLTGTTSQGIIDPSNIKLNKGCSTELEFSIDNNTYVISRYRQDPELGNNLKIIKNGTDISGTNLTSSNKILTSELGVISNKIIRSIMIISQGMPDSFSSLSSSARKTFLEDICNTEKYVNELKDKLSLEESNIKELLLENKYNLNNLNNTIISEQEIIDKLQSSIDSYLSTNKFVGSDEYSELVERKDILVEETNLGRVKLEGYSVEVANLSNTISNNKNIKSRLSLELDQLNKELSDIVNKEVPICPTCKQEIKNGYSVNLTLEIHNKMNSLACQLSECEIEIEKSKSLLDNATKRRDEYSTINTKQYSELSDITSKLSEFTSRNDDMVSTSKELMDKSIKTVLVSKDKIVEIEDLISKLDTELEIVRYLKSQTSRDFRSYLLSGVLDYLNIKSSDYSSRLFDTSKISLTVEGNNLSIYLDDKSYNTLSGGERRRVDIVLQLALRDLYKNQSNINFNLLVLDEALDYLDDIGVSSVLELLRSKSSFESTIIVVTHKNELPIDVDDMIQVEKDSEEFTKLIKG